MFYYGVALIRIILLLLLVTSSLQLSAKVIELRKPPSGAHGDYLLDVLNKAYSDLGYSVNFVDVPGIRELQFVAKARLSGVLARSAVIEKSYPNLIKVSVPLLQYRVLMYTDRRVCGYCFPNELTEIAFPRSGLIYKNIVSGLSPSIKKIAVSAYGDIESLLLKGRVSAAIVSNIEDMKRVEASPHFMKRVIERGSLNHYLSPENIALKVPLEKVLHQMQSSGELAALKRTYGLYNYVEPMPFEQEKLIAVSGEWLDYTMADGSGTYWSILREIFEGRYGLEIQASTWERSVRLFANNGADILVGAYRDDPKGYISPNYHIDYESDIVVFAKTRAGLESFETGEEPLNACAPKFLETNVRKLSTNYDVYIADVETCLALFEKGRMDVVIQYPYNLETLKQQNYSYKVLFESEPLFVMFQNSERGQYLKKLFDENIERLAADGTLKKLFPSAKMYKAANIN